MISRNEEMVYIPKPQTNYERIKSMSIEEMAEFISLVAIAAVQNFDTPLDVIKAQNIEREKWVEYLEREARKK